MTTLMQASNEWMKRPADERFTSLPELHAKTIPHQDARVDMERKGGNLLDLVAS